MHNNTDKCIKLPNFIDITNLKKEIGVVSTVKFLFMGRLVKEKGIFDTVRAFNYLKKIKNIELNINPAFLVGLR